MIGLDVAGRYGKRLGQTADDVWNAGLIMSLSCLIVARLWNVIQFWEVYASEPGLIASIRPSGFVWAPGMIAGLVAGYAYMLWRALDPLRVLLAIGIGITAAWIVQSISHHLTGALLGSKSDLPWALPYYYETRHTVALYEAAGAALLWLTLEFLSKRTPPVRIVLLLLLGWGILLLITRAFTAEPIMLAGVRAVQLGALAVALAASWLLGRGTGKAADSP